MTAMSSVHHGGGCVPSFISLETELNARFNIANADKADTNSAAGK